MKVIFGCAGMVYDGNTPENEPLGGSESALVYLGRALAARGVRVKVYKHFPTIRTQTSLFVSVTPR
jgi:hypothetical protein